MIIVVNRFLLRKNFSGICLWPFLLVNDRKLKKDRIFINHEKIHYRQQMELVVLLFYLWYTTEFLWKWMKYKNSYIAYKNISFEREAYTNEKDLNYLKKRPFFNFIKFL